MFVHGPGSRWHATRSLIRAFRRSRPDVVHCHNALVTSWVVPAARWAGVPVIVSTRHGLVPPPFRYWRELQFACASRWVKAVVGVCQATTSNLALAPFAARDRLITIYNGASPAPQPVAPLDLPKRGFTLVYVGRLAAPKDFPTLLKALALVRTSRKDVFLWVVGDGVLRPSVEKLCAELGLNEAVTFWGERADTGAFFNAADLCVLSSKSEGLPISLLEAMAAGRPVVAAAPGAVPEIVEGLSLIHISARRKARPQVCASVRDPHCRDLIVWTRSQASHAVYAEFIGPGRGRVVWRNPSDCPANLF